jgi:ferredoxin
MSYRKAVIYFLSGTGNSYRVSTWLEQQAAETGLQTKICSVNNADPQQEIESSSETLLGLVFPTHGFTAPWHMIKFALGLPRRKATHAFCMATRAGVRFGKVFLPGISGSATFLISLILFLKGYRVRGVTAIDMPSNWYSLHPIQRALSIERIKQRAALKVEKSLARLLKGRRMWLTWNNLYETSWGILLAYISLLYLAAGRFFLAKLFFANRNCDGCGICATNCPVGAIKMQGADHPWPFWRYNCESCMKCAAFCPKNAIESGHSWAVLLWITTSGSVAVLLQGKLVWYFPVI